GCRRDYHQARLRLRKADSHVTPASILLRVFTAGEKKVGAYFFFDSRVGSSDSFAARLESPGRYSSCSAAAKAFSKPTMSSPGRSVSKDSTSFRSSSSEYLAALIDNPMRRSLLSTLMPRPSTS